MAYIYDINSSHLDSHQAQPWCIVAFLNYQYPDTYYLDSSLKSIESALAVNKWVAISDPLSVSVTNSKGDSTNTAEMVLSSGDTNYSLRVNSGDHCFVWMHHDRAIFDRVSKALSGDLNTISEVNQFDSGLKFYGKVNSSREMLMTQANGQKSITYSVSAQAFTEMQTMIYYNPYIKDTFEKGNSNYNFYSSVSSTFDGLLRGAFSIQDLVMFYINVFIGYGPSASSKNRLAGVVASPNSAFLIPRAVSQIFGVGSKKEKQLNSFADLLNVIAGIQKYTSNGLLPDTTNASAGRNQKFTKIPLRGKTIGVPDLGSNSSLISLIRSIMNPALNELYFTLRANETGQIYPTMVVREKPFGSIHRKSLKETKFSELPRWRISESRAIGAYNIGTSNATRVNYISLFGQLHGTNLNSDQSQSSQILDGNTRLDYLDTYRSGSRTMFYDTNVDVLSADNKSGLTSIGYWTELIADWDINLHLKLNGTMNVTGISEPIPPGDNLMYDGKLFHIEAVKHDYSVAQDGVKSFSTNLALSHGVNEDGTYAFNNSKNRSDRGSIAPGFSNSDSSSGQ